MRVAEWSGEKGSDEKVVIWDEYDILTVQEVLDAAAQEFPRIPHDKLILRLDRTDGGHGWIHLFVLRKLRKSEEWRMDRRLNNKQGEKGEGGKHGGN